MLFSARERLALVDQIKMTLNLSVAVLLIILVRAYVVNVRLVRMDRVALEQHREQLHREHLRVQVATVALTENASRQELVPK